MSLIDKRFLIGIGPTRCGTTWLFTVLQHYPEFCFSSVAPKESHIIDRDMPLVGMKAMDRHFSSTDNKVRFVCDITPTYCGLSVSEIGAVAKVFPDAAIVAFVRNPVDRAISGVMRSRRYAYLGNQGETRPGSLSEAWALNGSGARIQSNYDRNIERWRRFFPESVHIVEFDEIASNPKKVIEELFEFLDVSYLSETLPDFGTEVSNRSSDIEKTIGTENELVLLQYWIAQPSVKSVGSDSVAVWRARWIAREAEVKQYANPVRSLGVRTVLALARPLYFGVRQLRRRFRAKRLERALVKQAGMP